MGNPQTDVIVPVHDAMEFVQPCIDSLFQKTRNFRLILVDDFSQPETTAYLLGVLQRQPTALYIRTAQQKWWTRAVNIGLRMARTQRVVLLNSDCVLGDGWLEELFWVWEDAGAMGLNVGLVGSVLDMEDQRRWMETKEPNYVTGHAWLVSMPALYDISHRRGDDGWYLDELSQSAIHINSDRFGSYELNRAGYATLVSYKAAVGHHGGKSWGYNLARINHLRVGNHDTGEVFG